MLDLSRFAVQMLVKFAETSCDQVNEAFDLNQKMLSLQQTMTTTDIVNELEQEFPFNLSDR